MLGLTLAVVAVWATVGLAHSPPSARSLKEMMAQADLVFPGVVDNIEYVLSEPAGPEQVRVPYMLVTYRVARVFAGQAPGPRLTLQFIGGLNRQNMRYMAATETPQFDKGDEDIPFVQGNTMRPCPLVGNRHGRTFTLSCNNVYTTTTTVALPAWLTSGVTYYLGVIIDDNGGPGEVDEANNAAYHTIKVN